MLHLAAHRLRIPNPMTWTFQLDAWSGVRLGLAIVTLLTVPGWVILSYTSLWRGWSTLTRWMTAWAISIAVVPVTYYGLRALAPAFALDWAALAGLMLVLALVAAWRWRSRSAD